jgi:glc operon protein GlcG
MTHHRSLALAFVVGIAVVVAAGPSAARRTPGGRAVHAAPAAAPAAAGTAPAATLHYPHEVVAAALARGAVLFDGAGDRPYMVHASRRDAAGEAEVHLRDTDVIYVIAGAATLVTGGTVVDGRPTAPGEIRGPAIAGGEDRRLAAGDVIVVPNGTPHWFREVAAPVTYLVVKAR